MIVGIDLGTTNSAVGYMSPEGPRLIPNALGEVLTPSVVGIAENDELLVGRAARELSVVKPERCAGAFKRQMGNSWTKQLAGHEFTPEKLSSLVLASLKQDAEAFFSQPITEAVITVPAYFNEHQRKATLEAGRIAGLSVLRILNEPTAAAIAYGFHEAREEKILLVADLGGGTFDVSIVEMFEGTVEVRASSGDSFLGGEDFTARLAARVLEGQKYVYERIEFEAPLLVSRMKHLAEAAKCRLSSTDETTVRVPNLKGEAADDAPQVIVTRKQFEEWTESILRRTETPLRRALSDAGLSPERIDEVILVGGATRMPAFVARLHDIFGKEPQHRLNPDEVVAMGAAVQAGLIGKSAALEDLVVTDVAPFTLGIETCKEFGGEPHSGYMLPIIHRNTTIPVSRVKRVVTLEPNQSQIRVRIFQGENRRIDGNILLGEFVVDRIPRGPAGQEIDVRFTYDLNGILEVEATIVETKHKVSHLVTRHVRGLSQAQITQAVAEMQSFKLPPRDEAAFRALVKRAERVFAELSVEAKCRLGQLLDGFEDALETGDREVIDRHREAIEEFLDEHDLEPGV